MYIKEINLITPAPQKQFEFFKKKLSLNPQQGSGKSFFVQVGSSRLNFNFAPLPVRYHYAFNIPSSMIAKAAEWLKQCQLNIILHKGKAIVEFPDWNARSIYFYDADNNIVELIARANLNIPSCKLFSANQLLSVSEIGIPVTDIEKAYNEINKRIALPVFDGNFDKFFATGDDHGLLILINYNQKTWFPADANAIPSPMGIAISEKPDATLFHINYDREILSF